jgi:PAP2 superfamily
VTLSDVVRSGRARPTVHLRPLFSPTPVHSPTTKAQLRRLAHEAGVIVAMLLAYDLGRYLAARHVGMAFEHAETVWQLERWLHLPNELMLQSWVLDGSTDLMHAANIYYAGMHFPVTLLALMWLFILRPSHYLWARRALVTATAVGLVIEFVYPLAPPRMLTDLGFVDAADRLGESVYDAPGVSGLTNQFAAMPSLHVGWALLVAIVLISASQSQWRWLFVAHPILTSLVVVVTANHFWLDGIVGAALVLFALAVHRTDSLMHQPEPIKLRALPAPPSKPVEVMCSRQ